MTAIALVGGDGAGKTTLAEALAAKFPHPVKYVYMGTNVASSNVALPSTRLVHALKVRSERKARARRGEESSGAISLHEVEHRRDTRGRIWATARLLNRFAEASLRQMVSWWYQARGYLVIYDRHFYFDLWGTPEDQPRLTERIHMWFLQHIYPQPDLVLFLDAPAEVMHARKQEVPLDYLEGRRLKFLARGAALPNFVVIDASVRPEQVYDQAARLISELLATRSGSSGRALRQEVEKR